MRNKFSRSLLALSLCFLLPVAGCNHYNDAQNTVNIIAQIVQLAQADMPALQAAGVFTASEATAVTSYLAGLATLDGQAKTCVTALGTSAKDAAILSCFNAFAAGLMTPAELAELRILSPKAQQKVELWVTAATLAMNATITILNGTPAVAPQLASVPSREDLAVLRQRLNLPASYETYFGE